MHAEKLEQWQHSHNFTIDHQRAEKKTQIVMALTATTMIVEVIAGSIFGSMALLADGWHMATHVGAFGITLFAYYYANKNSNNPRYSFGTGKVSVLGGFASAIALGVVAFIMILESIFRLFTPHSIQFNQAINIAIIGLIINLISAFLLNNHDHHHHDHHHHDHHHHDHNLQAAYIHVLADALTSVLAIIALVVGKYHGWLWPDPVMAMVGGMVILKWASNLIQDTGLILLDGEQDQKTKLAIVDRIEQDHDNRIADIHLWYLSQSHLGVVISLVTHYPQSPDYYKQLLQNIPNLSHIVIEVNTCQGEPCLPLSTAE